VILLYTQSSRKVNDFPRMALKGSLSVQGCYTGIGGFIQRTFQSGDREGLT
jgi:hypothetical protein